ncbi:hypothetical protein D3C85_1655960 [compost metagenome]
MVCVRHASLISTTRMSATIASSILRMVSACRALSSGVANLSMRAISVRRRTRLPPSTSVSTVRLNALGSHSCQSAR